MLMKILPKLLLLGILVTISLPSTAQQLIRLQETANQKAPQPVTADIKATVPARNVTTGDRNVTVSYTFTNALLTDDSLYEGSKWWKMAGFGFENRVTKPSVLHRLDLIEIPKGSDYKLTLVESAYTEFDFELTPAHPDLIDNGNENYSKNNVPAIDPNLGLYPARIIEDEGVQTYRGVDMVQVKVSPIQYDPSTRKVRAYTKIRYRVDYVGDMPEYDDLSTPEYAEYVLDHEFTDKITLNPSKANKNDVGDYPALMILNPQDYLILTVPEYKDAVYSFAEWKKLLGFNTHVVSRNDWTVERVRQTVQNMYTSKPTLRFLLIVGDYDDVPAATISTIYAGDEIRDLTMPIISDMPYACMDGRYDIIPDIHRGRVSVSSRSEAETVLTKIRNYEFFPETSDSFYNKSAHCAYFQDVNGWGSKRDGYEDRRFVQTCEDIRNAMIRRGKTVERIYTADLSSGIYPTNWNNKTYSNGEPIPEDLKYPQFAWDGDADDIVNAINEGVFYVLHRDHGKDTGWGDPSFETGDIDRLSNGKKLPVVFSLNCRTGKFNSNEVCFAEKFLRHGNGGCVAIYGATYTSYSGYNDVLAGGMFDAIWPGEDLHIIMPGQSEDDITETPEPTYMLGQILDQGFSRMEELYGVCTNTAYTKYLFHCFGDPSMRMRTAPLQLWRTIPFERDSTCIRLRPGKNTKTTFYDLTDNSIVSYDASDITFRTDHAENITVCVSAPNRVPVIYFGMVPDKPEKSRECRLLAYDSRNGNETATFTYELGTDTRDARIHIVDIYGNQRLSVNADADSSSVTADIGALLPGIYIATLVVDGDIVNSIRIIVSK